jgi:HEAT repeat protein
LSLARVAELRMANIESAEKSLQALAQNSENQRIRYAAASALAAGNLQSSAPMLVELARAGTDAQRIRIEPALIRWKTTAALELWTARLLDASTTNTSFQLATDGLVAINHSESVESLLGITVDSAVSYTKRMAAAKAAAVLSVDRALTVAEAIDDEGCSGSITGVGLVEH